MVQLWQCTEMLMESKSVTGRELSRRDQEQRWQNPWCASCLMSVLTCLFCACTNISILCLHMCERVPLQTCVSVWGLEICSRLLRLLCTFPFLCFFFLFVQRPSLNLKFAVWASLVGQWAPGIPLSLIFSTGIADTHQLPDFYLILGLELPLQWTLHWLSYLSSSSHIFLSKSDACHSTTPGYLAKDPAFRLKRNSTASTKQLLL